VALTASAARRLPSRATASASLVGSLGDGVEEFLLAPADDRRLLGRRGSLRVSWRVSALGAGQGTPGSHGLAHSILSLCLLAHNALGVDRRR
jgi:hypothetical protein